MNLRHYIRLLRRRKRVIIALFIYFSLGLVSGYCQEFVPYQERSMRFVQGVSFSEDGNTMYFTLPHKEFLQELGLATDDAPRLAIYFAFRNEGGWSKPELMSFSGVYKDYEPTLAVRGKWMFFNTNRPDSGTKTLSKNGIWFSRRKHGEWQEPRSLKNLNEDDWEESYPAITRKKVLFYVKETETASGSAYHIFQTRFRGVKTTRGK